MDQQGARVVNGAGGNLRRRASGSAVPKLDSADVLSERPTCIPCYVLPSIIESLVPLWYAMVYRLAPAPDTLDMLHHVYSYPVIPRSMVLLTDLWSLHTHADGGLP